jgi:predicted CoA-binding protein
MVSKKQIDEFFSGKDIGFIGLSRDPKSFSRHVFNDLKQKGYNFYPVNPNAEEIDGTICCKSISELPENVDRLFIATPKPATDDVIDEALGGRFGHIWLQQNSETPRAIEAAEKSDKNVITQKCIMMFAEPVKGVHSFHRFFVRLFGAYPK